MTRFLLAALLAVSAVPLEAAVRAIPTLQPHTGPDRLSQPLIAPRPIRTVRVLILTRRASEAQPLQAAVERNPVFGPDAAYDFTVVNVATADQVLVALARAENLAYAGIAFADSLPSNTASNALRARLLAHGTALFLGLK